MISKANSLLFACSQISAERFKLFVDFIAASLNAFYFFDYLNNFLLRCFFVSSHLLLISFSMISGTQKIPSAN